MADVVGLASVVQIHQHESEKRDSQSDEGLVQGGEGDDSTVHEVGAVHVGQPAGLGHQ